MIDVSWYEAVLSLGVGLGLAAAVGLRVFLPLLVLGIAARLGWITLADGFEWLASGPGIGALGTAALLEVSAYYVPWLDNLLDAVAGPLAIVMGVLATAAVVTDLPPVVRWAAAIVAGGGTTAAIKGLMSVGRLKSTAVTGGAANPVIATFEWIGALATSIVALLLPVVAVVVAIVAVWLIARAGRRRWQTHRPVASP